MIFGRRDKPIESEVLGTQLSVLVFPGSIHIRHKIREKYISMFQCCKGFLIAQKSKKSAHMQEA